MSEKHLHSIKGGMISRETLLAYVRGELSGAEKQHIDDVLKDDPFLQDAVEGLQYADHHALSSALDSIYQKVDSITGVHQSSPWMSMVRRYAVAATLFVFTTISILVILQLNKTPQSNDGRVSAQAMVPDTITNSGMGSGSTEADSLVKGDLAFENKIPAAETEKATFSITENSSENSKILLNENQVANEGAVSSGEILQPAVITRDAEKATADAKITAEEATDFSVIQTDDRLAEKETVTETAGRAEDKKEKPNKKNTNKDEIASSPAVSSKANNYDAANDSVPAIYTYADVQPSFKGGVDSMNAYLANNLRYPPIDDVSGNVYVKFVVNEDGSVSNAVVLRGIGKKFDDEALRLVNEMPKWNPGIKNGKPVKVYYVLVVKYSMN